MKVFLFVFTLIFSSAGTATLSFAVDRVNDKAGVALDGHDVVAYFQEAQAVKGSKKWVSSYQEIDYHFSSSQNKQTFDTDPSAYVPMYGGWCAWAVSYGKIGVRVDYNEFFIRKDSKGNQRLFLFFPGTSKLWKKRKHEKILKTADKNWEA